MSILSEDDNWSIGNWVVGFFIVLVVGGGGGAAIASFVFIVLNWLGILS